MKEFDDIRDSLVSAILGTIVVCIGGALGVLSLMAFGFWVMSTFSLADPTTVTSAELFWSWVGGDRGSRSALLFHYSPYYHDR